MTAERRLSIQEDVAQGVVEGFKLLAADEKVMKEFWKQGWAELAEHTGNGASQWVGKRILTALIVAITSAGVVWLVRSGNLK